MVGEAIVKRGGVRAVESVSIANKYNEYGANRVQGGGQAMAVAQHSRARTCAACFQAWSYLVYRHDSFSRVVDVVSLD